MILYQTEKMLSRDAVLQHCWWNVALYMRSIFFVSCLCK